MSPEDRVEALIAAILAGEESALDVDGLAGDEIPLLARIVSIADSFDAMTSDRPYRQALELTEAVSRPLQAA